jgi:leucyl aminopeptidase (aminopeptidase T)
MNDTPQKAVLHILTVCGNLKSNDKVLVVFNESTKVVSNLFKNILERERIDFQMEKLPESTNHAEEPSEEVAQKMLGSTLIICLTKYSMAHTKARKMATDKNSRFLSLPYYDYELLSDPAIRVDYKEQAPRVRLLQQTFSDGGLARVTSVLGTDIILDISGRYGNYCPGIVENSGDLGSPPDIEANVSPVENASNGLIVVDGSITCDEFGLLETSIYLTVEKGKVVSIASKNSKYVEMLEEILGPVGSLRRVVAELGVGVNPLAKLTGRMLTDEGAFGHIHFGLGSNSTVGGQNEVSFHLDFVIKSPSLWVDGRQLIDRGNFC